MGRTGFLGPLETEKVRTMAKPEDIPEPTRSAVLNLECPAFATTPFVTGGPLAQR